MVSHGRERIDTVLNRYNQGLNRRGKNTVHSTFFRGYSSVCTMTAQFLCVVGIREG